jgi:hydrogenase maturation protease
MKDEGVGVHVVEALSRRSLPEGVEAIDAGTSPEIASLVVAHRRVIVVDAAYGGGEPGTIYRIVPEEIGRGQGLFAGHDAGALEALRHGVEPAPEVVFIGVEPAEIGPGTQLSPRIAARLEAILDAVGREIERGGQPCS